MDVKFVVLAACWIRPTVFDVILCARLEVTRAYIDLSVAA